MPPEERWIPERRMQISNTREEWEETSDLDSSVFNEDQPLAWLTREGEWNLTKQNLWKKTRMMFPRDFKMLIALGIITVTSLTM